MALSRFSVRRNVTALSTACTNSGCSSYPVQCHQTWNIGKTPCPSQGCSPGQSDVLRSGLHGRLVNGLGRKVPLPLSRRRVAYARHSTHTCVGTRRCEKSAVAFLSTSTWPPHSDQDRQCVGGGVHNRQSVQECAPLLSTERRSSSGFGLISIFRLRALHIVGAQNFGADLTSRGGPRQDEWRLHPSLSD